MMKKLILIILTFLVATPLFAEALPPLPEGPLVLTSITDEQLTPDYWIDRLPEPDKVLKDPEELEAFNQQIHKKVPERVDIFKFTTSRKGSRIKKYDFFYL